MKQIKSIEKLLEFRNDAIIEQNPSIDSLFTVSFLDSRPWTPSSTIMEEMGISFHGCGVNHLGSFVILSTHKQETL